MIPHPMQTASEYLLAQSAFICRGKPLIMPQYPPDAGHIQPGEVKVGNSELRPNCIGLVVACACNADDAQALLDLIADWQQQRLNRAR